MSTMSYTSRPSAGLILTIRLSATNSILPHPHRFDCAILFTEIFPESVSRICAPMMLQRMVQMNRISSSPCFLLSQNPVKNLECMWRRSPRPLSEPKALCQHRTLQREWRAYVTTVEKAAGSVEKNSAQVARFFLQKWFLYGRANQSLSIEALCYRCQVPKRAPLLS